MLKCVNQAIPIAPDVGRLQAKLVLFCRRLRRAFHSTENLAEQVAATAGGSLRIP